MPDCPFCDRINTHDYIGLDAETVAFEPLNPVTPGHLLIVPKRHVRDAALDPWTTARVMYHAAALVQSGSESVNLITSIGSAATQTVLHLHVHLVPRREGDGLRLPWADIAARHGIEDDK